LIAGRSDSGQRRLLESTGGAGPNTHTTVTRDETDRFAGAAAARACAPAVPPLQGVIRNAAETSLGGSGWSGSQIIDVVENKSVAAIGWVEMGDCAALQSREDFRKRYREVYPDDQNVGGQSGQVFRFIREMKIGTPYLP